jgi:hypothetical protein
MNDLLFKEALERALKVASKDVRRANLLATGAIEAALNLDPTSEQASQFVKEFAGVVKDHADERGFFGDPYRDERHNAYIFAKRWLPEQYHGPIGVTAGTPGDFDASWKAKYL